MLVTIEKKDMRGAKRFLCSCCVVTKALQRVFESSNISFSGRHIRIKDQVLFSVLESQAGAIASDFDQKKDVVGRTFEITESNVAKILTAIHNTVV